MHSYWVFSDFFPCVFFQIIQHNSHLHSISIKWCTTRNPKMIYSWKEDVCRLKVGIISIYMRDLSIHGLGNPWRIPKPNSSWYTRKTILSAFCSMTEGWSQASLLGALRQADPRPASFLLSQSWGSWSCLEDKEQELCQVLGCGN